MAENMNWLAFLAIGLVPSLTSIVVALIQYNKGKSNLELEMTHMRQDFQEFKADMRQDVKCVEKEVGKVKENIVDIEKDVALLKGKGLNYAVK